LDYNSADLQTLRRSLERTKKSLKIEFLYNETWLASVWAIHPDTKAEIEVPCKSNKGQQSLAQLRAYQQKIKKTEAQSASQIDYLAEQIDNKPSSSVKKRKGRMSHSLKPTEASRFSDKNLSADFSKQMHNLPTAPGSSERETAPSLPLTFKPLKG